MKRWLWVPALMLGACVLPEDGIKKGDTDVNGDGLAAGDTATETAGDTVGGDTAAGDELVQSCPRDPPPPDYTRKVVVSHPYDAGGGQANTWKLWELDTLGNLTDSGETFEMGRATSGRVAFTGDGEIGIAVQVDGSLGVFRLSDPVEVLYTAYLGDAHPFYASDVIVAPDGSGLLVVDGNWRNNGGGIYSLRVACDGTLKEEGKLAESKLAETLRYVPGGTDRVVMPARDVLDSALDTDVHLFSCAEPFDMASADSFGTVDTNLAGFDVTADGRYVLVADNNEWYAVSHQLAIIEINWDTLTPIDVLMNINDPVAIVTSPFDDAALVLDGYGNGLHLLAYDPTDSVMPFTNMGEPVYLGPSPQLPASAVVIERGALTGWVLISENVGVRRVTFEGDGTVTDLGLTSYGPPTARIIGALGVQP